VEGGGRREGGPRLIANAQAAAYVACDFELWVKAGPALAAIHFAALCEIVAEPLTQVNSTPLFVTPSPRLEPPVKPCLPPPFPSILCYLAEL